MTIGEVLGPMMIPLALALAALATLLLVVHLARRYPSVPKRVPLNIRIDGRPSQYTVGKAMLWLAPVVIVAVLAMLSVLWVVDPPAESQRSTIALAFVVVAEVAWYVAWALDRQIEMARKMTYRVAPARMLRAGLPIVVTIVVTMVVAARH